MKSKYLNILRCPDCKLSFKARKVYLKNNQEIIRGILACGCRKVSVLEGIVVTSRKSIESRITGFLEKYATNLTDNQIPYFLFQRPLPNWVVYLASKSRFFDKLTLGQFLRLMLFFGVYKPKWYLYLTKRVSPSLNSAFRIPDKKDKVIDLGCGAGGLLQKLQRVPFRLGVDFNLSNLYLAKKYLSPGSDYVYHNLNHPLPFKRGVFDVAISNDAFHYVRAKKLLAGEISRILKRRSVVFLGHVHNSLVMSSSSPFPVAPKDCLEMFAGFRVTAFKEGRKRLSPATVKQFKKLPFLNFLFYRGDRSFKASR